MRGFWRVVAATVIVMVTASLLGGMAAAAAPSQADAGGATTFVGKVRGLKASLAVVIEGGATFAYLCDGGVISEWFKGPVDDDGLSLSSPDGSTLIAERSGSKLGGNVFVGDKVGTFTLKEASGDAGLYRFEQVVDGIGYVAGWVVQPDGSTVGNVAVATLPGAAVAATPPLLTEVPKNVTTVVNTGAVGQLAPPAVVAQLPPAPPPANQVEAVPSSFGVNTTTDPDGGGGTPGGQTPGDVGGATPPTTVPELRCEDLADQIDFLQKLISNLQKGIEDAKQKRETRRQSLLQADLSAKQKLLDGFQDQFDDEC